MGKMWARLLHRSFMTSLGRRALRHFYAFDLLWLEGRGLPLIDCKRMLRQVVRRSRQRFCTSIMSSVPARSCSSITPSPARQARIDERMERVHSGTDYAAEKPKLLH
jgi:ATP-dependent DNA ligase